MLVLFLLLRFFEFKRCTSLADCYYFTLEIARCKIIYLLIDPSLKRFAGGHLIVLMFFQSTLIS